MASASNPSQENEDYHREKDLNSQISLSDLQANVSYEERLRLRESMAEIGLHFEEQRRKVEKGLDIDYSMADLIQSLQQFDPDMITTGKDLSMDGLAVKQYTQLLHSKVTQFRDKKNAVLNVKLFAEKVKSYAANIDPTKNVFEVVGRQHRHLFKYGPSFDYMRPNFNIKTINKPKPKKEKRVFEKTKEKDNEVVVTGKTTKEVQSESANDDTLAKQLDNIRKALKKAINDLESDRINYYRFVIDPTDYGKTIENIFYMSFLIKDGYAQLEVDPEIGLPDIVYLSHEKRSEFANFDRSHWDTSQYIMKFTYTHWEKFIEYFNITKPLVERRAIMTL